MGRVLIVLLFVAAIVAGSIGVRNYRKSQESTPVVIPAQPHAQVFSPMSYSEATKAAGSRMLLVDATATWCPPCKAMDRDTWTSPDIAAWVKENGLAVQVDVDQDKAAAGLLGIQAMPTVILFKDGKELARNVGYMDAYSLLNWLKQHAG